MNDNLHNYSWGKMLALIWLTTFAFRNPTSSLHEMRLQGGSRAQRGEGDVTESPMLGGELTHGNFVHLHSLSCTKRGSVMARRYRVHHHHHHTTGRHNFISWRKMNLKPIRRTGIEPATIGSEINAFYWSNDFGRAFVLFDAVVMALYHIGSVLG